MALEYFLYNENYNNTLVDRSHTTFAPTPPGFDQILIDFLIPETQPLYLYKEDAGLIVLNDEATINQYLSDTAPPPAPEDPIESQVFTGYTATTKQEFTGYTDVIAPVTYVNVSGDSMTGSLSTSGNFTAVGAVTGSSVSASVLITTPVLNASTSVSAPQITGTTCITSPISCATTRMQAPVVCGSICSVAPIVWGESCVCSPVITGVSIGASSIITTPFLVAETNISTPNIYVTDCLCSAGETLLSGATTAASFLNVSGDTRLGSQMYMNAISTGGTLSDYNVVWNPITKQFRTLITGSGGTACVYCYTDCRVIGNNATDVDVGYISGITWSLSEGYYEYEYNATFGNNTTNRCAIVCFLMNGAVVGYCNLMKTNDTNVIATAYITQNNQLSGGTYQPSIVYRQCGGGTTSVYFGSIRVQRIGDTA